MKADLQQRLEGGMSGVVRHTSFICFLFFFFNDTATTEIYTLLYTLSLHDALPICSRSQASSRPASSSRSRSRPTSGCSSCSGRCSRSEEHTSELQSHSNISYA